jgi:phage shock protein A
VSTLITKEHDDLYQKLSEGHDDLYKKIMAETAAGHEQMLQRTETAMTHGRELMMRVTGDSQRLSIEYIVRELTAAMNQALQAGRENLLHSMRSGWTDVKQQTAVIEAQIQKLKEFHERLERELTQTLDRLVATAAASKPVVEHTYVTAEAVEVMPPERPRKKVHHEPEVMDPPPAGNGQAGAPKAAGTGVSIADIEQQARRELERLGAQGMNIFKRKK